jgi:hypothetical protein
MRVLRSLEELHAAENLEPGWRLTLERVMGDTGDDCQYPLPCKQQICV